MRLHCQLCKLSKVDQGQTALLPREILGMERQLSSSSFLTTCFLPMRIASQLDVTFENPGYELAAGISRVSSKMPGSNHNLYSPTSNSTRNTTRIANLKTPGKSGCPPNITRIQKINNQNPSRGHSNCCNWAARLPNAMRARASYCWGCVGLYPTGGYPTRGDSIEYQYHLGSVVAVFEVRDRLFLAKIRWQRLTHADARLGLLPPCVWL